MKVKFSGIGITDGRGKIGSNFIGKNRGGTFGAQWSVPANPASAYSAAVRSNWSTIVAQWSTITEIERLAWIAATVNYPRYDSIGNLYYPSGQQLFLEVNQNLFIIGQPTITTPPIRYIPATTPDFTVNAIAASNSLDITFADSLSTSGISVVIYSTNNISPGRYYIKFLTKLLSYENSTGQTFIDLSSPWASRYGFLSSGMKISVQCLFINNRTGDRGLGKTFSAIVT